MKTILNFIDQQLADEHIRPSRLRQLHNTVNMNLPEPGRPYRRLMLKKREEILNKLFELESKNSP